MLSITEIQLLFLRSRVPLFLAFCPLNFTIHWAELHLFFSEKRRIQMGNGQNFFWWNFFSPSQRHPLSAVVFAEKHAVDSTMTWDKPRLCCSIRLAFRCIYTILHSYAETRHCNHSIFFSAKQAKILLENIWLLCFTHKSKSRGIMFLTRYQKFISRWRCGKKDTSQEIMHQTVLHLLAIAGEERWNLYVCQSLMYFYAFTRLMICTRQSS